MSHDPEWLARNIAAIAWPGEASEFHRVGDTCERLEPVQKHGEYAMIPYVRIWKDGAVFGEVSQHPLSYVEFAPQDTSPTP